MPPASACIFSACFLAFLAFSSATLVFSFSIASIAFFSTSATFFSVAFAVLAFFSCSSFTTFFRSSTFAFSTTVLLDSNYAFSLSLECLAAMSFASCSALSLQQVWHGEPLV
ncbi:unnamed protein product [Linum trigynum]|uniref:Secreted peptide n=1 Tax=Linum trigynum TaxID=586398 RepID=A0AAV2D8J2_9ROSI